MQKGNALKFLVVLHKALLVGQLVFATACAYLIYSKSMLPAFSSLEKQLQVAALLLSTGGVYAGRYVFKKKLQQIRDLQADAKAKFAQYRSASMTQWALLEAPSLFCIVCFFLTGNYASMALAVVIIFLFVLAAPSKSKILTQLQISEAELEEL